MQTLSPRLMTDALWPSWSPIGGVCRKMRLVLPPCNSDTSAMYGVKQSLHVRSNKAQHTCESSESLFITQVGIFKRSGLNSEKVQAFVFFLNQNILPSAQIIFLRWRTIMKHREESAHTYQVVFSFFRKKFLHSITPALFCCDRERMRCALISLPLYLLFSLQVGLGCSSCCNDRLYFVRLCGL